MEQVSRHGRASKKGSEKTNKPNHEYLFLLGGDNFWIELRTGQESEQKRSCGGKETKPFLIASESIGTDEVIGNRSNCNPIANLNERDGNLQVLSNYRGQDR